MIVKYVIVQFASCTFVSSVLKKKLSVSYIAGATVSTIFMKNNIDNQAVRKNNTSLGHFTFFIGNKSTTEKKFKSQKTLHGKRKT